MDNKLNVKRVTIVLIKRAMALYDGNKTHAAKALGMNIRTLRYWITRNEELHLFKLSATNRKHCGKGNHMYEVLCKDERMVYLCCSKCSQFTKRLLPI